MTLNADSLGGNIGELQSHNVFAYCSNNPVIRIDPNGQVWRIIGAVVGAVVGAVAGAAYSYYSTGSIDWRYVAGGAAASKIADAIEMAVQRASQIRDTVTKSKWPRATSAAVDKVKGKIY